MEIHALQTLIKERFGNKVEGLSLDYGVARLLVQAGQLGEAVVHGGDVGKELSDVVFVMLNIANRRNVDIQAAINTHLVDPTPEQVEALINKR